MSTTATNPPQTQTKPGAKEQFLEVYQQEHERTMRVLRAYPEEKAELRPHPKAKAARELAWMFVLEQGLIGKALTTGFDWSKPPSLPLAPESLDAIISGFERDHKTTVRLIGGQRDDQLSQSVKFFTAPKTIGDMPMMQFLWLILHDQIHHRGQFSVYLRMADGKVPSIYGPSLDEPWR